MRRREGVRQEQGGGDGPPVSLLLRSLSRRKRRTWSGRRVLGKVSRGGGRERSHPCLMTVLLEVL
jgi:hypothetical protein